MKVILVYQCGQEFREKMFESLVASILNGILGKYIKDLDSSNLNLGILKGEKTHDYVYIEYAHQVQIKQVKYLLKYLKQAPRSNCGNDALSLTTHQGRYCYSISVIR